jgi:hypothetical protein
MGRSPFPGMDPYLEGEMWPEFHTRLANVISEQLLPRLRPKYVALLEKRFVTDQPWLGIADPGAARGIYPDVGVARRLKETATLTYSAAVTPPAAEVISGYTEEVPLTTIEIRDVANRRLVTVIEILSPVNKRGDGAREYNERCSRLLQTQTYLLELDLLRGGLRLPVIGELPPAAYYVYLSRFTQRPRAQVWAIGLRDRLPVLPIPLLPPDADVLLDLQAAVQACFELVGYEALLEYDQPVPPPPLSAEDAAWAKAQLDSFFAEQRAASVSAG